MGSIIYDHHTLQNRFYYSGGNTALQLRSAVPVFRSYLEKHSSLSLGSSSSSISIAFPDAGATKRFGHFFPNYPLITCAKQRIGDKRVVIVEEGDPVGRDVIIMDDLVRSGGTIIECAQKMVQAGAKTVSAYCTHAEFTKDSWKKFLPDTCAVTFHRFFISDSCPATVAKVRGVAPFEVVSLEEDIRSVLETIE
jgi:phosphoribosylpyrophosphate synthetase